MNVKTDQGPVIQPSGQFLHTKQRDDHFRNQSYFGQFTVICDAKGCNEKRMYRSVHRKFQFLLKNGCKFFKHGRSAYNVNSRNLITMEKFFGNNSHFFNGCLDYRKNFIFFFRSGL